MSDGGVRAFAKPGVGSVICLQPAYNADTAGIDATRPSRVNDRRSRRRFLAPASPDVVGSARLAWPRICRPICMASRPLPSPSQLEWQRDEFALFLHFGVNTFTDREWGDGTEDPAIFNPTSLDARAWARAAQGGRRQRDDADGQAPRRLLSVADEDDAIIRSRTVRGAAAAAIVVREFVDACRAEGLKPGLYLSPWDRHEPLLRRFAALQRFLLRPAHRAADAATADSRGLVRRRARREDPKASGQRQAAEYDWPRFWAARAQAAAEGGDVLRRRARTCAGSATRTASAGDPNWSTVDPNVVPCARRGRRRGDAHAAARRSRRAPCGGRAKATSRSGRAGSITRRGRRRVKTVDQLVNLYFTSVGRNSKLLLNVPPTRDGLLHETDVARLAGMRERLNTMFARDLAAKRPTTWKQTGKSSAMLEVDLGQPVSVSIADLREDITLGQRVAQYTLEGRTDDPGRRSRAARRSAVASSIDSARRRCATCGSR